MTTPYIICGKLRGSFFQLERTMKRFTITLVVLFLGSCLWGQDCKNFDIHPQSKHYDDITQAYLDYLLKDCDTNSTSLPPYFKSLATCWLKNVEESKDLKKYSISEHYLSEYPEIIFLVMTSKSLADQKDKQSWFNLMPIMNDEQMDKLYDILTRERLKINSIEKKYERKKQEIVEKYRVQEGEEMTSLPTDTILEYLGYATIYDKVDNMTIATDIVDFWKWNRTEKEYISSTGNKKEHITLLKPEDIETIKQKVELKDQFYIDKYDEKIYSYLLNLKYNAQIFPKDFESQQYVLSWWDHLMEKFSSDRNKSRELYRLATIEMEKLVDFEKENALSSRNFYIYSYEIERSNYGKAAEQLTIINSMRSNYTNPQLFVNSLYVPVICLRQKKSMESGKALEQSFVDWYNRIDKSTLYKNMDKTGLECSIMLCDYYLKYGENVQLKDIVRTFSKKIKEGIDNDDVIYSDSYERWYEYLNQSYLNGGFNKVYDFEGLKDILIQNSFYFREDEEEEAGLSNAHLVEYACYYALYQMLHDNSDINPNLSDILGEVITLCNDPASKAYKYIEKHIAADLRERLKPAPIYREPTVTWWSPKEDGLTTENGEINVSFTVGHGSMNIVEAKVYFEDGTILDSRSFRKDNPDIWSFDHTMKLSEGNNNIDIKYKDATGKNYSITRKVIYTPKDYTVRKDIALLFAVDNYSLEKGFKSFTKDGARPTQDAEKLVELLKEFNFETHLYKNPTADEIDMELRKYASKEYEQYDQLLIFFSGHGSLDTLTNKGYFAPTDGNIKNKSRTMISYDDLQDLFKVQEGKKSCRHILVIADACHSGAFIKDTKGADEYQSQVQAEAMQYINRSFIGSARANEESNSKSEIIAALDELFKNKGKDYFNFNDLQSAVESKHGNVKVIGRWGDDNSRSSFYFNRKKSSKL